MSVRADLSKHDILEIERCRLDLDRAAILVDIDPIYLPIFERCDRELQLAMAKTKVDPVSRARALLAAKRSL